MEDNLGERLVRDVASTWSELRRELFRLPGFTTDAAWQQEFDRFGIVLQRNCTRINKNVLVHYSPDQDLVQTRGDADSDVEITKENIAPSRRDTVCSEKVAAVKQKVAADKEKTAADKEKTAADKEKTASDRETTGSSAETRRSSHVADSRLSGDFVVASSLMPPPPAQQAASAEPPQVEHGVSLTSQDLVDSALAEAALPSAGKSDLLTVIDDDISEETFNPQRSRLTTPLIVEDDTHIASIMEETASIMEETASIMEETASIMEETASIMEETEGQNKTPDSSILADFASVGQTKEIDILADLLSAEPIQAGDMADDCEEAGHGSGSGTATPAEPAQSPMSESTDAPVSAAETVVAKTVIAETLVAKTVVAETVVTQTLVTQVPTGAQTAEAETGTGSRMDEEVSIASPTQYEDAISRPTSPTASAISVPAEALGEWGTLLTKVHERQGQTDDTTSTRDTSGPASFVEAGTHPEALALSPAIQELSEDTAALAVLESASGALTEDVTFDQMDDAGVDHTDDAGVDHTDDVAEAAADAAAEAPAASPSRYQLLRLLEQPHERRERLRPTGIARAAVRAGQDAANSSSGLVGPIVSVDSSCSSRERSLSPPVMSAQRARGPLALRRFSPEVRDPSTQAQISPPASAESEMLPTAYIVSPRRFSLGASAGWESMSYLMPRPRRKALRQNGSVRAPALSDRGRWDVILSKESKMRALRDCAEQLQSSNGEESSLSVADRVGKYRRELHRDVAQAEETRSDEFASPKILSIGDGERKQSYRLKTPSSGARELVIEQHFAFPIMPVSFEDARGSGSESRKPRSLSARVAEKRRLTLSPVQPDLEMLAIEGAEVEVLSSKQRSTPGASPGRLGARKSRVWSDDENDSDTLGLPMAAPPKSKQSTPRRSVSPPARKRPRRSSQNSPAAQKFVVGDVSAQYKGGKSDSSSRSSSVASSSDESTYPVEDLREMRRDCISGLAYYLVKWEGYPESDNTWEPRHNLLGNHAARANVLDKLFDVQLRVSKETYQNSRYKFVPDMSSPEQRMHVRSLLSFAQQERRKLNCGQPLFFQEQLRWRPPSFVPID